MEKFYCIKCKTMLNKSKVRAKMIGMIEDKGYGMPLFFNKSIYYCSQHNLLTIAKKQRDSRKTEVCL